jgi:hypothetical protein
VLGVALGLVCGVGFGLRPSDPEEAAWAGALETSRLSRGPSADCSDVDEEIARVGAEIDEVQRAMDGVRLHAEGVPIPWSEVHGGPQFLPEAFEAAMASAEADCPGVDIVRVDCSEPPCLAWVQTPPIENEWDIRARVEAEMALVRCQKWARAYGGYESSTFDVDCDGTFVHANVLGPPRRYAFGEHDPEFDANVDKRLRARRSAVPDSWPCSPSHSP